MASGSLEASWPSPNTGVSSLHSPVHPASPSEASQHLSLPPLESVSPWHLLWPASWGHGLDKACLHWNSIWGCSIVRLRGSGAFEGPLDWKRPTSMKDQCSLITSEFMSMGGCYRASSTSLIRSCFLCQTHASFSTPASPLCVLAMLWHSVRLNLCPVLGPQWNKSLFFL